VVGAEFSSCGRRVSPLVRCAQRSRGSRLRASARPHRAAVIAPGPAAAGSSS
jgi:hypothetical protein